jgi:ATP:ADP antiporter, AAA family
MMGLFFLIVCAVGILRPIKNSLALDGLGATDFYKVYLVSAVVVLFVPVFTRAADRLPWRLLIPGVALFFASNLVLFRLLYVEGSAAFGVIFYGWYDLFAAALVTQFFMTTQLFFDARAAKRAYPIVIAGGSLGATLGGAITGFFAQSLGTPNLLLVAALMIVLFSVAMPLVWTEEKPRPVAPTPGKLLVSQLKTGELRRIFGNPHVRLIAGAVLLTILVKQLVDFQYNALTKEVFDSRDAVTAFQGKFNAATQWLPLVVLAALRPALRRWGVGVAVLLLPVSMFVTGVALVVAFGLMAGAIAKGAETALRYSAERAGREILYVPVPDEIKLKAKAYIDVAVEKGLGKVLSAVLLAGLLAVMPYRQTAYVTAGLAAVWVVLAVTVQREYVRTLKRSIEGRFASLRGLTMALTDASSLPVLRRALTGPSPVQAAFTLELLAQEPGSDIRLLAPELNALVRHSEAHIRAAALTQLARVPGDADEDAVRACLGDDAAVADAALRVLLARRRGNEGDLLRELLASERTAVRTAALRYLVQDGRLTTTRLVGREYIETHWSAAQSGDAHARAELALATGGLQGDPDASQFLEPFLDDTDARVRSTALRSAALLGRADLCERFIAALGDPATRQSARDALAILGERAVEPLTRALLSESTPARVRRALPSVLAQIPHARTVEALLQLVLAPETDQVLDYRSIKALSKLRARHADLNFAPAVTWSVARRELEAAQRYAAALTAWPRQTVEDPVRVLLRTALTEGWQERRASVFRCIGMLHSPVDVYRSYVATSSGTMQQRANSLEWLENAMGHARYQQLAPALEAAAPEQMPPWAGQLPDLSEDGDAWIACLWRMHTHPYTSNRDATMQLVEKVLLLQRIDLLRGARGAHLALLASIADEITVEPDAIIISAGEPTTAMYIVTRGSVVMSGVGQHVNIAVEEAFGTLALIDESPSPLEARAAEPSQLLRISRADFHDLLADHSELSLALLQGLARRMRALVG